MKAAFKTYLVAPIQGFRLRYLPLMMIYFAFGASAFSGIAESFFVKERLHLSAHELMAFAVWLSLPWTIKMVFGQWVDSIPIFGSIRRVYIFIAAGLMAAGSILLAGLAAQWHWVVDLGSARSIYFTSSLITVIGVVLQDVVADAMTVEVVPREGRTQQAIEHDLAMVQLLGRLSLSVAIFLVAGLGGWLAHVLSYKAMFLLTLIIPVISLTGCLLVKIDVAAIKPVNWTVLGGGLLFALFVVCMGLFQVPYAQEIIFAVSLVVISYFMYSVTRGTPAKPLKKLFFAAVVIFVFRAMPGVGPGLQWWEIDVLGFNKAFFGTLGQIGAGLSIVGMWFFAKWITEKPIGQIFIVLTIISFFLGLPVIGMYYGLHHWTQAVFGFGAQTIALVDTAVASPFAQLSMIPMLTLIAINAPKGNAATWFALMGSLMNLALTAGALLSKHLNKIWVVAREITNAAGHVIIAASYDHLGVLLWITSIAGLVVPVVVVCVFLPGDLWRRSVE